MLCIIIHLKIEINGVKKNFFLKVVSFGDRNFQVIISKKKKSRKLHRLHRLHFGVNLRDPRVLEPN